MKYLFISLFLVLFSTTSAFADCPVGTWASNLFAGPGGGMYEGPGGGLYAGPGGGMYEGPGGGLYAGPGGGLYQGPGGGLYAGPDEFCSNRPPLPIFAVILERWGYSQEAELIWSYLD